MAVMQTLRKSLVASALVTTLGLTGAGAATAAPPSSATTPQAQPVGPSTAWSEELRAVLANASPETRAQAQRALDASAQVREAQSGVGNPVGDRTGTASAVRPTAVWIRVSVKAAVEVIKKTSPALWKSMQSYVLKGREAFVKWWDSSVPQWAKNLLGGVSAAGVYDALRWILGLD